MRVITARATVDLALSLFLKWWNDKYFNPRLGSKRLEAQNGRAWIKIVATGYWDNVPMESGTKGKLRQSVYAFIDPNTGDMYKPASWSRPAKGIRANLFDKTSYESRATAYTFS